MHTRDVTDTARQDAWIQHLEQHNVFFSAPLDLDFMMLGAFPKAYEETVGAGALGPSIPRNAQKYAESLDAAIKSVLKENGGDGSTYSEEEQKQFFWYRYLFLGRSKPSTHILAMSKISDADLLKGAPAVLSRVIKGMKAALADLNTTSHGS